VEEFLEGADFERIGRGLECHRYFPERTNVSFVQVEDAHQLKIQIWERGVGATHSSGTGSCGAAVAAIHSGRAQSPVEVETRNGSQRVEWNPGEEIFLTGEAEFIGEMQFDWKQRV
jgi:diaminopimelate epimerase